MKKLVKKFLIVLLLTFDFSAWASGITAEIRLDGERPKGTAPAIVEYQGPCGTKKPTSVVKLWKSRVLDVTLWLTSTKAVKSSEQENPVIISKMCEFKPKLTVAIPGSTVKIAHQDSQTQWLVIEEDGGKKEQVLQEPSSDPVEIKVSEDIKVHILSGFYPWMEAWIKPVPDLIASAVTDWDGRVYFNNILPGIYILHTWHPSLGETSQEIEVKADKDMDIEIKYQWPELKIPIIEATTLEELFGGDKDLDENPFKK